MGKDTLQPVALHSWRCRAAREDTLNRVDAWRQRLTQQCRAKQGERDAGLPAVPSPIRCALLVGVTASSQRGETTCGHEDQQEEHAVSQWGGMTERGSWWPETRSVVNTDTERTAGRMGG